MGGDLRHLDEATLALLTNPEVIAVNQRSSENRPHFVADGTRVWSARAADGGQYLALFNTGKEPREVAVEPGLLGLARVTRARDVWARRDVAIDGAAIARRIPAHGAELLRLW